MLRIMLCDDHIMVREGIRHILEESGEFKVVGQAEGADSLFKLLSTQETDALLLDITLGTTSGLDVLTRVKSKYPKVRVLMVSMAPEHQLGPRAASMGASGYVQKDSPAAILVDAAKAVASGRTYFSEGTIWQLTSKASDANLKPHLALSEREMQVMLLLGRGVGIKEIGNALSLSSKTVSTYKLRILDKMNFKSTADIVRYMIAEGL